MSLLNSLSSLNLASGGRINMDRHRYGNGEVFYNENGQMSYPGQDLPQDARNGGHYDGGSPGGGEYDDHYRSSSSRRATNGRGYNNEPENRNGYQGTHDHSRTDESDGIPFPGQDFHIPRVHLPGQQLKRKSHRYPPSLRVTRYQDGGRPSKHESHRKTTFPPPTHDRDGRPRTPESVHRLPSRRSLSPDPYPYPNDKRDLLPPDNFLPPSVIPSERERDTPPTWIPFMITGFLLLALGVVNILFCLDQHFYCRLWAGFLAIEFSIFGLYHRGYYLQAARNWLYMVMGLVNMLVSFVAMAFVTHIFVDQVLKLANSHALYILSQEALDEKPHVDVLSVEERVWVCFAFDTGTLVLLTVSITSIAAVCLVADRFWKRNFHMTRLVEPFCLPYMFNPYSQILLNAITAWIGIVTVFACTATDWHEYWAPVWAAALGAFAGGVTVAAIKRDEKNSIVVSAFLSQLLSLLGSLAAIVLCVLGIVDNIKATRDNDIILDPFTDRWVTASAALLAVAVICLMINLSYSFYTIGRLIKYMYTNAKHPQQTRISMTDSDPTYHYGYNRQRQREREYPNAGQPDHQRY